MYKCEYFNIHELVPKYIYQMRGEKAWSLLDDRALITLDKLRGMFGPMIVNDYRWGGERQWSGLRTSESPHYSPYSQHSFGRAFDVIFNEVSVEHVRRFVLDSPTLFPYINAIELDVSWFHFDTRNCERIFTFKPK